MHGLKAWQRPGLLAPGSEFFTGERGEAPAEGGVKARSPPFPSRDTAAFLDTSGYSTTAHTHTHTHTHTNVQIQRKTTEVSLEGEGIGKRGEEASCPASIEYLLTFLVTSASFSLFFKCLQSWQLTTHNPEET